MAEPPKSTSIHKFYQNLHTKQLVRSRVFQCHHKRVFVKWGLGRDRFQNEMIGESTNKKEKKKAYFMTKPTQQLSLDTTQEKEREKAVHFRFLFNHVRFMLIP